MPMVKSMAQRLLKNAAASGAATYNIGKDRWEPPDKDWIDPRTRTIFNPMKATLIAYTPGRHHQTADASHLYRSSTGRYFVWLVPPCEDTVMEMTPDEALVEYSKAAKNPVDIQTAFPDLTLTRA